MAIGLHILYGVMGSGKTNYAVNEMLDKTKYRHVVCNVPLTEEYKKELENRGIKLEIFDKLEPKSVIDKINSDNPQTFFIVDESQLCLTSANVSLCKRFAKQMSQIRQDDQDVNLIAQSSKMLPSIIKEVATDCYKFDNNNKKGFSKSSHVMLFNGGFDYQTRVISEFTFNHVYGKYLTSNWEQTEKPKVLYKGVYIKLGVMLSLALALILYVVFGVFDMKKKYFHEDLKKLPQQQQTNGEKQHEFSTTSQQNASSFGCVRSFKANPNGTVQFVNDSNKVYLVSVIAFSSVPKCPIMGF